MFLGYSYVFCVLKLVSGMKSSTLLVFAATCFFGLFEYSHGTCQKVQPLATLFSTLCSSSTLNTLPPTAIESIVNTLSTTPQLYETLSSDTLLALLNAITSSPTVLSQTQPTALLTLLTAISNTCPTAIRSLPQSVLHPLLNTLSSAGLLPKFNSHETAPTYVANFPPLPPPPPQIIVPGPPPGPIVINLPKKSQRPRPVIIPSGPPPSIVVSIPDLSPAPPPVILPQRNPGPIVINENSMNVETQPIVVPAPEPPSIYFTTHSANSSQGFYNPATGERYPQYYFQSNPQTPKVYLTTLPPGVAPPQCLSSPPSSLPSEVPIQSSFCDCNQIIPKTSC
ncbi:uncharacterized protein LOC126904619 [Daktulosphaira vitifoliae]|uniref:uncharacterized protein LOC126904619 n=1 Tax=Daktulosphaira vitifoliae TaxID=58002 RepID=UPI0021AA373F|nr:uncharacterized protein LOC126904619 [Daktulosphaira vitifoliae]